MQGALDWSGRKAHAVPLFQDRTRQEVEEETTGMCARRVLEVNAPAPAPLPQVVRKHSRIHIKLGHSSKTTASASIK